MIQHFRKHLVDRHKRTCRTLGYVLHDGSPDAWIGLATVLSARLTDTERAALAWAVLRSLPPEQVVEVAETVLPDGTGAPVAPLFNYMDQAAHWADMAEPEALEAYCLASFNAMPRVRQAAFLDFAHERQVA